MADNTEKLVMLIEAQNKDVLRKLKQIERQSKRSFDRSAKSVGRFNGRLETTGARLGKLAGLFRAGGPLAAVAVGIGAAGAAAVKTAQQITDLANEAERAGVKFEAFQELAYVAERNRIPIDALTDGMKELNLRADEFIVTGKGPAAEAFQRLGFGAEELKRQLEKPEDLLVEIIGRLQHLDTAAQIRVSDEIFGGTAGERFVELIDQGAAGLERTRKEARDLGLILNDEVKAKAQEISEKFSEITSVVGTELKAAVVNVAYAVGELLGLLGEAENSLPRLQKRIDKARRSLELERESAALVSQTPGMSNPLSGFINQTEVTGAEEKYNDLLKERVGLFRQIDKESVSQFQAFEARRLAIEQSLANLPETPAGGSGGAGSSGGGARGKVDDFTESLNRAATSQQRLSSATGFFQSQAMNVFSEITSQINTGNRALDSFLQTLLQVSAQSLLFNSGPLAGILGGGGAGAGGLLSGLFGGFRAAGGPVSSGKAYMVGERGPEMIVPRGPGTVIPNNALGATGGSPVMINIDATGADAAGLARVQGELLDLKRTLPGQILAVQRQQNSRGTI